MRSASDKSLSGVSVGFIFGALNLEKFTFPLAAILTIASLAIIGAPSIEIIGSLYLTSSVIKS